MTQRLERCPHCEGHIVPHWPGAGFERCTRCQLLIRNPFPSDEELAALYVESWQDPLQRKRETGGTSIDLARYYSRSLASALSVEDFHGLRILDFGAGRGAMMAALSELGADVYGVDPFGSAFLRRQAFKAYSQLRDLPKGLRFDGIVTLDVIEHLTTPWTTLGQLAEFLKMDGWMLIATPNAEGMHARISASHYREAQKPGHLMLFAPTVLAGFLRECGFSRYRRQKWFVPYSSNPLVRVMHYGTQMTGLEGELRYIAWK